MSYSIKVESDTFMDYYIQKIISILILHRYFRELKIISVECHIL